MQTVKKDEKNYFYSNNMVLLGGKIQRIHDLCAALLWEEILPIVKEMDIIWWLIVVVSANKSLRRVKILGLIVNCSKSEDIISVGIPSYVAQNAFQSYGEKWSGHMHLRPPPNALGAFSSVLGADPLWSEDSDYLQKWLDLRTD